MLYPVEGASFVFAGKRGEIVVFRDYLDIGASHKVRRVKRLEHEHRYVRVTTVRSAMVHNAMVHKNRSVSAVRCEDPGREKTEGFRVLATTQLK